MTNLVASFSKELATHQKSFESVLPAHIEPKKFMRTVVGAVQNNPKILECNRQSIFSACQKAAQDGLILDGREAALVQFKGSAQYMPMVAGVLKKLRNSGMLSTIVAQTVHKNDNFKYNPAMDDVPNHSPDWFGDRGEMIGVYAVARMKDGGVVVEIMNMQQIDKVRNVSRSKNGGPWQSWPEEMAKKSVLRRIAKYLPSSADVDQMFDHDNENFTVDQPEPEDEPTPVKPAKKQTRAASVIAESSTVVNDNSGAVLDAEVVYDETNYPQDDELADDPI
jgi:recombination protein RecT